MFTSHGATDRLDADSTAELPDYKAISRLAVASLLLGIASITALAAVPLWIVPLIGVVVSLLAFVRIAGAGGTLGGRPLAVVGLCLAVFFGSAALAGHWNSRRIIARQAEETADQWFAALARHDVELAHQWTVSFGQRSGAFDLEQLRKFYEKDSKAKEGLAKFIENPSIALLLALGPRAHAQLVDTELIDDRMETVSQDYQISYEEAGKPQSFRLTLMFERRVPPHRGYVWWRISGYAPRGALPPIPAQ